MAEPRRHRMKREGHKNEGRAPLSKDRVHRVAVELVHRDGIDSLTMRKLAEELGVGAMSLYYYVANKEELLDGMIDVVFSEIELPEIRGDWRAEMRQRAISTREVLLRHPWAVGLMESRRKPGPANFRVHNWILGCLREGGFSIEATIHAYSLQDAYIYGFALQEKSIPFDTVTQSEAVAEDMVGQFASGDYPYLVEIVEGHVAKTGFDHTAEFLFGLDVLLDSLSEVRTGP